MHRAKEEDEVPIGAMRKAEDDAFPAVGRMAGDGPPLPAIKPQDDAKGEAG